MCRHPRVRSRQHSDPVPPRSHPRQRASRRVMRHDPDARATRHPLLRGHDHRSRRRPPTDPVHHVETPGHSLSRRRARTSHGVPGARSGRSTPMPPARKRPGAGLRTGSGLDAMPRTLLSRSRPGATQGARPIVATEHLRSAGIGNARVVGTRPLPCTDLLGWSGGRDAWNRWMDRRDGRGAGACRVRLGWRVGPRGFGVGRRGTGRLGDHLDEYRHGHRRGVRGGVRG